MASSESESQGFAIEALEAAGWLEARLRPGLARGPRKCFLSLGPSLVLFVCAEDGDHLESDKFIVSAPFSNMHEVI